MKLLDVLKKMAENDDELALRSDELKAVTSAISVLESLQTDSVNKDGSGSVAVCGNVPLADWTALVGDIWLVPHLPRLRG